MTPAPIRGDIARTILVGLVLAGVVLVALAVAACDEGATPPEPAPDTTAPSVPRGVAAEARSDTRIDVNWDPSTDDGAVDGYRLFRDGRQIADLARTDFSDTGLTPATTYGYTVAAYDTVGNVSAESEPATATTDAPPPPPDTTPPTVPGSVTATAVSSAEIDVAWDAATDDGEVAGYVVYREGSEVADVVGTDHRDTGLEASTPYRYTVAAYDTAGNRSGESEPASATTAADPDRVVEVADLRVASGGEYVVEDGLNAGDTRYTDRGYTFEAPVPDPLHGLTFIRTANDDQSASPGDTEFLAFDVMEDIRVYVTHDDRAPLPSWLADGFTDTGLDLLDSDELSGDHSVFSAVFPAGTITLGANLDETPADASMYTVILEGGAVWSDTVAPTVPANLDATAVSDSRIDVSWEAATDDVGVEGYRLFRDGAEIADLAGTAYSDTGLDPATAHFYTVEAYDDAGNVSGESAEAGVTTDASDHVGRVITTDAGNPRWLFYDDGDPFFLAASGGPEGFLYRGTRQGDGTRGGGDQEGIIDDLAAAGVNGIYLMAVRSDGGDGDATHNPWIGSDPDNGLDDDILDQWEGWFDAMDAAGITIYFFLYDDSADPFGGASMGAEEEAFVGALVDRFEHHDRLIWVVAEEYSESLSEGRASEIAAEIRAHDPVHPIAIHQLEGTIFDFDDDPNLDQFAIQTKDDDPDDLHDTIVEAWGNASGDYNLNMAELNNSQGHANHATDEIRRFNWAAATGGAYVMVLFWWEQTTPSATELAQLGYLRRFMELTRFDRMEPDDSRAAGDTDWVLGERGGNDAYVGYGRSVSTGIGFTDLDAGVYILTWLDPVTGQRHTERQTVPAAGAFTFHRPAALSGDELVLYARTPGF